MSEGLPIFFCERTGRETYRRGFECEDKHRSTRKTRSREWLDPKPDPIACDTCGKPAEMNMLSTNTEMRRVDTGELFASHRDLLPGAVYSMWDLYGGRETPHNWRQSKRPDGHTYIIHRPNKQDGRVLVCKLPDGHDWVIDGRARNCTLPDDDKHWCWVRTGRPEDGTLHVTKQGRTCSAGAGSIATAGYHGFLHHGRLTNC